LPPLRERKEDIHLLFRKFAADFAQKYRMPTVRLDETAQRMLEQYRWSGNIRQLRNVAEQLSVLEQQRSIDATTLRGYLPNFNGNLPAIVDEKRKESDFASEREILYKVLFDMKSDLNDLKKLTLKLMENGDVEGVKEQNESLIQKIYGEKEEENIVPQENQDLLEINAPTDMIPLQDNNPVDKYHFAEEIQEEETLSLQDKELELIIKSLERNQGKRKAAAAELGISERTLYRKIKQHNLEL
jgi:DNA-binding NtrC family response regulator